MLSGFQRKVTTALSVSRPDSHQPGHTGIHLGIRFQFLVYRPSKQRSQSQRHQHVPSDKSRIGTILSWTMLAGEHPTFSTVAGMIIIVSSLIIYFKGEEIVKKLRR